MSAFDPKRTFSGLPAYLYNRVRQTKTAARLELTGEELRTPQPKRPILIRVLDDRHHNV